jgi:nitrate reductase gamma subunit
VVAGHVVGLLVPADLTSKLGISEHVYHLQAVVIGGAMGVVCWAGILILTCCRLFIGVLRRSGTLADILTDLMLLVVITLGNCVTLGYQLFVDEYNYRETVSVWVRQLPLGHPDPSIMSGIPWLFQAHILAAFMLVAFWPFGRLVHVWTGPLFVLERLRTPAAAAVPATWADVTVVRLLRRLPRRGALTT